MEYISINDTTVFFVLLFLSLVLSASIHEATHAFVSNWLGDDTARLQGRLTINPLAHIDPLTTLALPIMMAILGLPPLAAAKPVPFNPQKVRYDEYGVALVGISGPLVNLALAVVCGLWLRFFLEPSAGIIFDFFAMMVAINVMLFVFNMIPFPPLDGSRLLFAFAPDWLRNLMRSIERAGIAAFLVFFLILYQFLLPVVVQVIDRLIQIIVGTSL